MNEQSEIITIVDKTEYQRLMAFLEATDPAAFITVYKVSSMKYTVKAGDYGTDMRSDILKSQ